MTVSEAKQFFDDPSNLGPPVQYRSELDGIRAIAVVMTIGFHTGYQSFSGGFAGVDVFFVLSGYLISQQIMVKSENGTFSFLTFYERRIRRLLPAYFLVIFLTIPFALLWMLPDEMADHFSAISSSAQFMSNIFFWSEAGYFSTSSHEKALIHFWSLAVEVQFYLLFPVLYYALHRLFGKRALYWTTIAIAAISFAVAEWATLNYRSAGYYLLPTRGWEFLAGAFCTFVGQKKIPVLVEDIIVGVGILAMIYPTWAFSSATPWPGVYTLAPVIGAVLVIVFASAEGQFAQVLRLKPMVFVGLISYSLYLFHQPVFAFARIRLSGDIPVVGYVALTAIAFLLSVLCWKWVEMPFRRAQKLSGRNVFITALLCMGIGVGIGEFGRSKAQDNSGDVQTFLGERLRPNWGMSPNCKENPGPSEACMTSDVPELLIWGDSFAMHLVPGILTHSPDLKAAQMTRAGCGPFFGVAPVTWHLREAAADVCIDFNEMVKDYIAQTPSLKVVVMSSAFRQYLNREGKIYYGGKVYPPDVDVLRDAIILTVDWLNSQGLKVVFVSPPPRNGADHSRCISRASLFDRDPEDCRFDQASADRFDAEAIKVLEMIEAHLELYWLKDVLCKNAKCEVFIDDTFIYRDTGHLSFEGSRWIGTATPYWDDLMSPATPDK